MDSPDQRPDNLSILNRLPLELLNQVIYTLPNADIKNLRLTCSYFGNASLPRFNRVFISTNPRDIEVFTLIANHDRFRFKVTEIIYDDSRFGHPWSRRLRELNRDPDDPSRVPYWFRRFYSSTLDFIDSKQEGYRPMPHVKEAFKTRCTVAESYEVYRKLKSQQDEIFACDRDADALRHGLSRFPNVKRVTLSPAAHAILGRPLYPMPTIRSLPEGLIYPVEQGWPKTDTMVEHPLTPWDEASKREWRGFCVVTKVIAQHIRDNPMFLFSELVVDSRLLWTGASCLMFESEASEGYRDLVTILSHPPLRRLELSFACGPESKQNWPSFRSGLLFRALSKANNLQDIRFDTNIPPSARAWHNIVGYEENGMPLRSMFPVKDWSNLRRFALSRSFVTQRDVIAFISTLPSSLEWLELSFLGFFIGEGTYRDLLEDMRCNLGWRERPSSNQPKLIVLVESEVKMDGVALDVSREAMDYMYHHGENPFLEEQIMEVLEGKGTPVNLLDPMYDEELYNGRVVSV